MPECLILGGVTTEMAIEDLNEALTSLIVTLTAQGEESQEQSKDRLDQLGTLIKITKANLMGIEIIADQEEGTLIEDISEE